MVIVAGFRSSLKEAVTTLPETSNELSVGKKLVTESGVWFVITSVLVEMRLLASFTWAVKLLLPAEVGLPLITPELDRVRPTGKVPAVFDQV